MKRIGEADIRPGTVGVGETKAEADRKAGIKLVIIVKIVARLETTLEPGLILDVELLCKGTIS